jgi:hypothetical protein
MPDSPTSSVLAWSSNFLLFLAMRLSSVRRVLIMRQASHLVVLSGNALLFLAWFCVLIPLHAAPIALEKRLDYLEIDVTPLSGCAPEDR